MNKADRMLELEYRAYLMQVEATESDVSFGQWKELMSEEAADEVKRTIGTAGVAALNELDIDVIAMATAKWQ